MRFQVQENFGFPTRATGSAQQAILSSKASPLNAYKSFTLKSQPCSRVEVKLGLTGRWIRWLQSFKVSPFLHVNSSM